MTFNEDICISGYVFTMQSCVNNNNNKYSNNTSHRHVLKAGLNVKLATSYKHLSISQAFQFVSKGGTANTVAWRNKRLISFIKVLRHLSCRKENRTSV